MRHLLSAALMSCLFISSANAVELNYKWKKGDVHRFSYEDESSMEMKMSGMPGMPGMAGMPGMGGPGGDMKMKVQSTFSEKVLSVKPDGTAEVELTIEKLDVMQGGRKVAALTKLPPSAKVTRATIDRKGHVTFTRIVTVYMQDDQMYVGITKANASATGASATAQAGDQKVELQMSVDPKTGTVTASATTSTVPPKLKKVEIREDAQKVDALPQQIFEMMVLPEGDMAPGSTVSINTPFGQIDSTLDKLDGGIARLHFKMAGKEVSATKLDTTQPTTVKTTTTNEDDSTTEETTMVMPGMPGMPGMQGMPGMPGATPKKKGRKAAAEENVPAVANAGMQMDADVHLTFDVANGKLVALEGTTDSKMSMGGMGDVKVHATPKLSRK